MRSFPRPLLRAVFKLDQVRLDEIRRHYHGLRAEFEQRQLAGGEGMWRTREWVDEVLRPMIVVNNTALRCQISPRAFLPPGSTLPDPLPPALMSGLTLDSHSARLAVVVEGILLVLMSRRSLVGVAAIPVRESDVTVRHTSDGYLDLLTVPFPETMVADAADLMDVQTHIQRIAAVNALSVTIGKVVMHS